MSNGTKTTEEEIIELKARILELEEKIRLLMRTNYKTIGEEDDQI